MSGDDPKSGSGWGPHDVVLYGAAPYVPLPQQPSPGVVPFPSNPFPYPWTTTNITTEVIVPTPRPEVIGGLAKLLPRLRDKLKADKASLSPDEVLAMVWLEGLAAGAGVK